MALAELKGVGPKMAEKLAKLGLHTVQDALFHLPLRYEDRTQSYAISQLQPYLHATVIGEIQSCDISLGKRRMLNCTISDGSGRLTARFFHFTAAQKNQMAVGKSIKLYGEIKRGKFGFEILHPEYRVLNDADEIALEETLTPVYPSTEGLRQASMRSITDAALAMLQHSPLTDWLPAPLQPHGWTLQQALLYLHRPPPGADLATLDAGQHPAQQRLIVEELLAHQLSMLQLRSKTTELQATPLRHDPALDMQFLQQLPFSPTDAQQRVVNEIRLDLAKPSPMHRLVQGDVGSGKTLVAALAALTAISMGKQVALMAPTEILAEQHHATFVHWFAPLGIKVAWLSGKATSKQRQSSLSELASGEAQLAVGTHALFQAQVQFADLSLVIIDEQHRFGVEQRLLLREKGESRQHVPHQLVMTATPIPRTLAMTAYADLDVSVIDQLPPGRTPISTIALADTRKAEVITRIKENCLQLKRQVYWVCTLIEESESLQCQAAEDCALTLQQQLPELSIGLVHGRMKSLEKQLVMDDFSQGRIDVLVATTVIEVGVDVPNASLIIIENPERLGLAQLHQLRGRVGRGEIASHCVLMYHPPLSATAQQRLSVLRDSNDGFWIAQRDLEIRGPGELLGTKQTGIANMKIADLVRDSQLLPQVQNLARHLWQQHPQVCAPLCRRWLADKQRFTQA